MINLSWTAVKDFAVSRKTGLQYIVANEKYYIWAFDGPMFVTCQIPIEDPANADQTEFETDYLSTANKSPSNVVTTQFELRDKTLKLASGEAECDETTGIGEVVIKIPGTPGSGEGRWIAGGAAWLGGDYNSDDKILGVWFLDNDNLLGLGAGTVIGSYTDDEMPEANQGWFIPRNPSHIEVEAVGGYGFAPAGFYLMIRGKKGGVGPFTGIDLYVNLEWGKIE